MKAKHDPNDCPRLCSTTRGCILGDQCPWHLARIEQIHQECLAEILEEIRNNPNWFEEEEKSGVK
jgi:hypothetical protein